MSEPFTFPKRYINFLKRLVVEETNPKFGETGWMKKEGGKRKWTPTPGARKGYAGGVVYTSPCGKFILKYSYLVSVFCADDGMPECAVPTYFSQPGEEYQWLLQPIVDTSSESVSKAREAFGKMGEDQYGTDAHGGNIGMLNGSPVVFDF